MKVKVLQNHNQRWYQLKNTLSSDSVVSEPIFSRVGYYCTTEDCWQEYKDKEGKYFSVRYPFMRKCFMEDLKSLTEEENRIGIVHANQLRAMANKGVPVPKSLLKKANDTIYKTFARKGEYKSMMFRKNFMAKIRAKKAALDAAK